MKCHNCSQKNPENNTRCTHCGASLFEENSSQTNSEMHQNGILNQTNSGTVSQKKKSSHPKSRVLEYGMIYFAVVVMAALLVVGYFWLTKWRWPDDYMLIGIPSSTGVMDLHLQRLGQELDETSLIEEAVSPFEGWIYYYDENPAPKNLTYWYGSFIPDTNALLYYMNEADNLILKWLDLKSDQTETLLSAEADWFLGSIHTEDQTMFLNLSEGDVKNCYYAKWGNLAEQRSTNATCYFSTDRSKLFIESMGASEGPAEARESLTLTMMDPEGENEVMLLDNVENEQLWHVSEDGGLLAYILGSTSQKVIIKDTSTLETVVESETFRQIIKFGFAFSGDSFYVIAETADQALVLLLWDGEKFFEIARGPNLDAAFAPTGDTLGYLKGYEDEKTTFYIYDLVIGEGIEVFSGQNLGFYNFLEHPYFLLKETNLAQTRLISVAANGDSVIPIYESDITITALFFFIEGDQLFIQMEDENDQISLFVTSLDKSDGIMVLENWFDIVYFGLLEDANQLLFYGRREETDNPTLYSVDFGESAQPVVLDDDLGIGLLNAIYTLDESHVIYTVRLGPEANDYQVRQIAANGEGQSKVLFDKAILLAAQWRPFDPFLNYALFWHEIDMIAGLNGEGTFLGLD